MTEMVAFLESGQLSPLTAQIQSLERLPKGWHYGEGESATASAVSSALSVADLFFADQEAEVFPGVDGGILFAAYCGVNETLEVRCNPDGRMDFWHEVEEDVVKSKENVRLAELVDYLGELSWPAVAKKNTIQSFASCTHGTTVPSGDALQANLFDRLQQAVFQLLMRRAPDARAKTNVSTSTVTTTALHPSPQYFGGSDLKPCFVAKSGMSLANLHPQATPVTGTFEAWGHREAVG